MASEIAKTFAEAAWYAGCLAERGRYRPLVEAVLPKDRWTASDQFAMPSQTQWFEIVRLARKLEESK